MVVPKISYSKLSSSSYLTNSKPPLEIPFNDQIVLITQYLPVKEKIDLVSNIVNNCVDDNNFYNPCRFEVYFAVEMVKSFTNIKFTEKQSQDIYKIYDFLIASGLYSQIVEKIPSFEYDFIKQSALKTIKEIYKYRNSALGIFETISKDYSNLEFDAQQIQSEIADPDNLALVKSILTKLG